MQTEDASDALERHRAEIDALNLQLLALLEARGRAVESIMALKRTLAIAVYDPTRESAMLAAVMDHMTGPYSREQLQRVFRTVFEVSRELGRDKLPEEGQFTFVTCSRLCAEFTPHTHVHAKRVFSLTDRP